jgi:capsular exopolysaccharide synthesis family protein
MSRIQDILSKAARDGTARRTRSLGDDYPSPPATDEPAQARGLVDQPAARPFPDNKRAPRPPVAVEPARLNGPVKELSRGARALRSDTAAAAARLEVREPFSELGAERFARAEPEALATDDLQHGVSAGVDAPAQNARLDAELDRLLVAALAPASFAAEQYRALRTRLKQAENGRVLRTIAVTSPAKGDGKSLTAANLALTMAQEFQQRVVLIDADLRRPSVHHLFGLGDSPGLGDVLTSQADLDQALVALPDYHLTVLPAGMLPSNPAELLGSAAMRRLLDTLRTRFDRILIDVPPVAPLADLHILAPLVDGLLMIVRAGITPRPAIERALSGLDQSKVLGLVLNESGGEGTDASNYEGYGYIAG